MSKQPVFLLLMAALLLGVGCKERREAMNRELSFAPGPHAMVYKTTGDYRALVPVMMSEDGSRIVSYPDPRDLRKGGELMLPIALDKGYFLDRRGIGPRVAFTSYTYEEYANLPAAPSLDALQRAIVDPDPLTDLCDCGLLSQYEDPEAELNVLITKGKLAPCQRLTGE